WLFGVFAETRRALPNGGSGRLYAIGFSTGEFESARIGRISAGFESEMKMNRYIEDIYPLSPMQEGMLFHTLYEPEGGVYVEQFNCVLSGGVDLSTLRKAWEMVVDRHSALRSGFNWGGKSRPLQVVRKEVELDWVETDWRCNDESQQLERLENFM